MEKRIVFIIAALFCISLASASISVHNKSISTSYVGGDPLKGYIDVSFVDTPLYAEVSSNIPGSTTLKAWLDANLISSAQYNCSTSGCSTVYSRGPVISTIEVDDSSVFGVSIEGQSVIGIDSISFTLQSASGPSCARQLAATFENASLTSNAYLSTLCGSPSYGCFVNGTTSAEIPWDAQYCERITLASAPAYSVGAVITNTVSTSAQLRMSLYNAEAALVGECTLPGLSGQKQSRNCTITSSSAIEQDYFVCLRAAGPSSYRIATESVNACGTTNFGESYPIDYEIYAQPLMFNSPVIQVNEENFAEATGLSLRDLAESYLNQHYGGSCSPYCVIPFTLQGLNQDVAISAVSVVYDIDGAVNLESNSAYRVENPSTLISSGKLRLDLSKTPFRIPLGSNYSSLDLFIDDVRVVNESIQVLPSFDFGVSPSIVLVGRVTPFSVQTTRNLSEVTWDFGDGTVTTTTTKQTSHRYTSSGNYTLSVEVRDTNGAFGRKTLTVQVGDAKTAANLTLSEYAQRIVSTEAALQTFPTWISAALQKQIDTVRMKSSLEILAHSYALAENDSDYEHIVSELIALHVPAELAVSREGNFPIEGGLDIIDTRYAEQLGAVDISNPDVFRSNLAYWMGQHIDGSISYKMIRATYDEDSATLLTWITLQVTNLDNSEGYVVIGYDPTALQFKEEYYQKDSAGGAYVNLADVNRAIEFITLDAVEPAQLGIHVLPADISPLLLDSGEIRCTIDDICSADEDEFSCPQDCKSYLGVYFAIALILASILGIVLAFVWTIYRSKYEQTLFASKSDLYNVVSFIKVQESKRIPEAEIKKRLASSGWNKEQIAYAYKKVHPSVKGVRFIKQSSPKT